MRPYSFGLGTKKSGLNGEKWWCDVKMNAAVLVLTTIFPTTLTSSCTAAKERGLKQIHAFKMACKL